MSRTNDAITKLSLRLSTGNVTDAKLAEMYALAKAGNDRITLGAIDRLRKVRATLGKETAK